MIGCYELRSTVGSRYNDPRYNDILGITIISKFLAQDNDFPAFSLVSEAHDMSHYR